MSGIVARMDAGAENGQALSYRNREPSEACARILYRYAGHQMSDGAWPQSAMAQPICVAAQ